MSNNFLALWLLETSQLFYLSHQRIALMQKKKKVAIETCCYMCDSWCVMSWPPPTRAPVRPLPLKNPWTQRVSILDWSKNLQLQQVLWFNPEMEPYDPLGSFRGNFLPFLLSVCEQTHNEASRLTERCLLTAPPPLFPISPCRPVQLWPRSTQWEPSPAQLSPLLSRFLHQSPLSSTPWAKTERRAGARRVLLTKATSEQWAAGSSSSSREKTGTFGILLPRMPQTRRPVQACEITHSYVNNKRTNWQSSD